MYNERVDDSTLLLLPPRPRPRPSENRLSRWGKKRGERNSSSGGGMYVCTGKRKVCVSSPVPVLPFPPLAAPPPLPLLLDMSHPSSTESQGYGEDSEKK
jgi:hypothetical protein